MLKALTARGFTTVTSALFGILTARLILGTAGVELFALYSLITALPGLMAFQDLGTGAALVNVIATTPNPQEDPRTRGTLISVWRVMVLFAVGILTVDAILLLSGGWIAMLGDAGKIPNASIAAFTSVALWALAVPFGIWQRILLGLGKNHQIVLILGLLAPINYLLVVLILTFDQTARPFLSIATYVATFAVATAGMVVASRRVPTLIGGAAARLLDRRRNPGVHVMHVGWPMLAQMIASPLSLSAQRYVLAQSAPTAGVAEYTAAAQVFLALLGVITTTGLTLWPRYARERAQGRVAHGPHRLSVMMATATAVAILFVLAVHEPLFAFTTHDEIIVSTPTVLAFGAMLMTQAYLYPLGMFIMDEEGIRFQVLPTLTMAVGSVALAALVTPTVGVVGPLLSNSAFVLLAQIIPFSIYIHRHRRRLWAAGET